MDENKSHHEASAVVPAGDPDITMEVLRSHVPITLLMDIGSAEGPDSEGIAAAEGGDADWLRSVAPATSETRQPAGAPVTT
jgi:hypothetical protein